MEATIGADVNPRSRYLFYSAIFLFIFVLLGFTLKVIVHPERLARYTPLVISHAVFMMAWLGLFAWQANLIINGKVSSHKRIGSLSFFLILAIVITGLWTSINLVFDQKRTDLLVINGFTLISFVFLYAIAIYKAKQGSIDTHKRMILFASISIIGPAIGRYSQVLGINELVGFIVYPIIVIVLPVSYDLMIGKKVHKATYVGITILILGTVLMMVLMPPLIGYFNGVFGI